MKNPSVPKRLGRYEIVEELGHGAMGMVYVGHDPSIGRKVAIKTALHDVLERSGMADEMMERFLREARAAGILNHPNIITIYDVGEEEGMAYFAMEFIEGKDLSKVMATRRIFDCQDAVEICIRIGEALACAHAQGVIHRDVKPANVMVPDKGPLKVTDFGIARTSDSTLTQEGMLLGSPSYMSPEQCRGQKVDARSDLFSLGIILYELVTGERPFVGEAPTTVMHNIVKTDPVPPDELNYSVPEALSRVIMKALSKRPQERYADGAKMVAALRECLRENPDMSIINCRDDAKENTVLVASATPPATPPPTRNDLATVAMYDEAPSTVAGQSALADSLPPRVASAPSVQTALPEKGAAPWASHLRVVVGVVAVLCLAAGLGVYALYSGVAPVEPEAVGQSTEIASSVVAVSVYVSEDAETVLDGRDKLENSYPDMDLWLSAKQRDGLVAPVSGDAFVVRVSDGATGDIFDEQSPDADGGVLVSIPDNAARVIFEVRKGAQVLESVGLSAPGWRSKQTFLLTE